ncbi:Na+/H+ antiporter NhaA [Arcobacter nitrofigilis DSM 7299]|uniref:Na(+)/H(+) antiporter NhaA n=1 Tax=Arcobacter nitrofigilis (strain ATCC 33309 / DSM 7299 / CCUG 15893 / LMG 7604 / NCTC 12251 / CI) TaxID=572480 RepID=D5V771_ARCNC|nr:Na+/H+ antiporter NhaA [Arcobacter nitrofigilis]ADG94491.1 Na+/H+ antiporter NhaA [Arcobacter nitrofigilis DSM 7299]
MKILVNNFMKSETSSGIILIFVTILALLLRNSFLSEYYYSFLHIPIHVAVNDLVIDKPLYLWINDGLMALFFLVVGLEIKRELLQGHLSSWSKISLPAFAALGGMLCPALIYFFFNQNDSNALNGWAIPTATDIAFSLGILSLLGKRVPVSLKIFLMALAIIDDIGAIVIIALFYTSNLSVEVLYVSLFIIFVLFVMNRMGISTISLYFIVGIILWVTVLKSGVHATLAGIILAFAIPLKTKTDDKVNSPVRHMEHNLHNWVAFFILPLFAFVNAGVDLREIDFTKMTHGVPLGIMLGLFFGKQLGVFMFSFIAVKLKLANIPKCTSWLQIYGIAVLTGIGFTMSLFIDSLAFVDDTRYFYTDRLAILIGSLFSGIFGYLILRFAKPKKVCGV